MTWSLPQPFLGGAGVVLAGMDPLEHVVPHTLTRFGSYTFTNHVLMLIVSAALLLIVLPIVARARAVVPKGGYNMLEAILQFLREDVARPALGENTDRFIPFLWTMFLLILTANLLGMVPLGMMAAPIDAHLAHIGGTATGNISITAGLALCSFIFIHVSGMRHQGVKAYWKNFVPHVPGALWPLMFVLEILGALVKPFALAVRLFANMLAGHIVIGVFTGFAILGLQLGGAYLGVTAASVLGAVAIGLLEVFVAFLQAYIFTFLTTLFVGMAVHPEH
jgi:F-type H+-transporting ATPase subunit a